MSVWTNHTLNHCYDQGIVALCYVLMRSPGGIRRKARELMIPIIEPHYTTASLPNKLPADFFELVELYGSSQAELCPSCMSGTIFPWNSGDRLGICPACYRHAQLDALKDTETEVLIERRENQVKKCTQRIREEMGTNLRKIKYALAIPRRVIPLNS